MTEAGRVYGGRSESERRAERRGRLITAGLELFGTEGWSATTIERLCSGAGVATRSFYEEFASREALLLAVYEQIMAAVVADVLPQVLALDGRPEEQIRVGLTGYVNYLTADPRRARVAHHEIRAAGTLEHHRHAMNLRFADLIAVQGRLPRETGRLVGIALAGAVSELLVDWVSLPEPRPDTSLLLEAVIPMFTSAILTRPHEQEQ